MVNNLLCIGCLVENERFPAPVTEATDRSSTAIAESDTLRHSNWPGAFHNQHKQAERIFPLATGHLLQLFRIASTLHSDL
jgi:hypothetical protein